MRYLFILLIVLTSGAAAVAQHYKYIEAGKISGIEAYKQEVKAQPNKRLVELKKIIPGIALDIR